MVYHFYAWWVWWYTQYLKLHSNSNNTTKPLIRKITFNKWKEKKNLYPQHPVRCIITGPLECGKSVFLTNLVLGIFNDYDKIYIYSLSLHQDLYQKLIESFTNYIPIHIILNILNEKDIDVVIDGIADNKDFEESDTQIETY